MLDHVNQCCLLEAGNGPDHGCAATVELTRDRALTDPRLLVTVGVAAEADIDGNAIRADPLPPGQVWAISPGGQDEGSGLYCIDVNERPGTGVHIANVPAPGPFRESVGYGEQNLIARARELVGDRDPREHAFTVQLRAFGAARSVAFSILGGLHHDSRRFA